MCGTTALDYSLLFDIEKKFLSAELRHAITLLILKRRLV